MTAWRQLLARFPRRVSKTPDAAPPRSEPCAHPADALVTRQAGTLSRTVVQTCTACGAQWTAQP